MNPRQEMNGYLNRLWAIFTHVTKVPRDDAHIEQFLMTMDEAKGLLAKLCTPDYHEHAKGCD